MGENRRFLTQCPAADGQAPGWSPSPCHPGLAFPRTPASCYLRGPLDLRVPSSEQGVVEPSELPVQGQVALAQLLPGCQELRLHRQNKGGVSVRGASGHAALRPALLPRPPADRGLLSRTSALHRWPSAPEQGGKPCSDRQWSRSLWPSVLSP